MKTTSVLFQVLLALSVAGLACNISVGSPAATPDARASAAALTLTAVAQQTPGTHPGLQPVAPTQPTPLDPSQPTLPPSPVPPSIVPPSAIPPTTIPIPCDRAAFLSETVKDGTKVTPGQIFSKSWTLRNNGSCPWTPAYTLVFDHGDSMGAPSALNLAPDAIVPGQTVELSVVLTAPNKPGTYQGYFLLKNASGREFGIGEKGDQAFWVKVVVEGAAGPTVRASGLLEIPQTWTVDLDSGSLGPASGADIYYEVDVNWSHNLVFLGPAKLFTRPPTFEDCRNAQMDSPTVPINSLSLGTFFCYVTDEGRFGYLEYAGSDSTPDAGKLYLEFTTWNNP
jgi:hypothetical protein